MTQTRVYLSVTYEQIVTLRDTRQLPAPLSGHAVTERFKRGLLAVDQEIAEYDATLGAVADAPAGGHAVILAADCDPACLEDDARAPTAVTISREIRLSQCSAFHVTGQDRGDPELSWYDITEIDSVLDLLDRPDR